MSVGLGLFLGINYRQKESVQVRAFVSDLSQFLRTARSHALVDGLQNVCIYDSAQGRIQEGLRGKSIQVPQGVRIIVENISEVEKIPLVSFYPDGSLVLEKMVIESEQHKYKAEADRLLGKVQFNEFNY